MPNGTEQREQDQYEIDENASLWTTGLLFADDGHYFFLPQFSVEK
jgi:hypothetical protein